MRVTDESSCYSTMVNMKNRRIGFLYEVREEKAGYDIEFKSLSLKEITNGEYKLLPKVNRSQYVKDALQRR